jgi:hypothetical protein
VTCLPVLAALLIASPADAQDVEPAGEDEAAVDAGDLVRPSFPEYGSPQAQILSDLASSHVQAKRTEGFVLLSWGLANVAGGAIIAGVGHEDDTWLFAGLTTMAWGAINAALSLTLLDLGGGNRRRAEQIRQARGRALFDLQNELADGQRGSAGVFALNAGLDVAYILAGVLLYALGTAQTPEEPWMVAVGGTAIAQGGALLIFDLVNWLGSNARADALRAAIP